MIGGRRIQRGGSEREEGPLHGRPQRYESRHRGRHCSRWRRSTHPLPVVPRCCETRECRPEDRWVSPFLVTEHVRSGVILIGQVMTNVVTVAGICNSVAVFFFDMPPRCRCRWRIFVVVKARVVHWKQVDVAASRSFQKRLQDRSGCPGMH